MQTHAVNVHCVACQHQQVIYVDPIDYLGWQLGTHAQDAFPYLNADERESLIVNMCLDCIEEMYADMEEEEDEDRFYEEGVFYPESDDPAYARGWYVG